ncbi:MAG: flavodoxin-dependent (E)-4-hydroxy-3-methylbut-2-enyl-diphosphate synthase [Deltaproteobacteria bacterium]|nr:flavodoxin-dependent (E)-4-hydroxy-3-methylbut-2-enyl-diphosphate synthase [Deltaproteobacteria bacterium]
MRRKTRQINVGGVLIGGDAPISVQSMTNTDTRDVSATINQVHALEKVGCEIVRVAVPNMEAAEVLGEIKKAISIPLIADIHFDYRLALRAIDAGVDGLRLNPGNIRSEERVKEVVKVAKGRAIPIRIGVNAGSLEKDILERYGHPTPEGMVESAIRHIQMLEDLDFFDIKVSLKASDVLKTIEAYRLLAERLAPVPMLRDKQGGDYPFHIGITEAGTIFSGAIKSAVGLGILLAEGIGDTLRVSLTGDPVEEVRVGWGILKALRLRERGVNVISCPTCGRIRVDAIRLAEEIERRLAHITKPINIAVMGCVVNGPGEAVEADIGIAGGEGVGLLYVKGNVVKKVKEEEIVDVVVREVEGLV